MANWFYIEVRRDDRGFQRGRGDTLDDLLPGSGAVAAAWAEWNGDRSPMPELPLEAAISKAQR